MDAVDKALGWGVAGAVSLGGMLYGFAVSNASKARQLKVLPTVESAADLARLGAKGGALDTGVIVAASGSVRTTEVLEDTLSKQRAVAAWVTQEELSRRRVGSTWQEDSRLVKLSRRVTPLALQIGREATVQLKPERNDVAKVLEHAVTISTPVKNGLVQQAIDTTFGYVVSAYVEKEYVLPEGVELTAIGLLTHDHKQRRQGYALEPVNGVLELSRGSLQDRIESISRHSRWLKRAAVFCGVTSVVLLTAYLVRKHLQRRREKRRRTEQERGLQEVREWRRQQARAAGEPEPSEPPSGTSEWKCVVCWEGRAPRMVYPACGHAVVCETCGSRLHRCPMCRRVSRPVQLFLA